MDFLRTGKRRSLVSNIAYNGLNIALAVAILVAMQLSNSHIPGFLLILVSKWRIFAVRPRYWFANIQANLVDIIVSIGFVVFLYAAGSNLAFQIPLTLLYISWLLFLKPRSKRSLVAIQAGIAVFIGVSALFMHSYAWPATVTVLAMWIIGYSAAYHVTSSYDKEDHSLFLRLVWAFVFAELGWLLYHWTIAYPIPGLAGVQIPQAAIIALGLSFVAERFYHSYNKNDGVVQIQEVLPSSLFVLSVISVLIVIFNTPPIG